MINGRQTLSIVLNGGLKNAVTLGPPPLLDSCPYPLTRPRLGSKRIAWLKLQECERRLIVAVWAVEGVDPVSGINHVFAEDCVTAVFQSIEATFQVLKDDIDWKRFGCTFDDWLDRLNAYSLPVRALRTIRHYVVHVGELKAHSRMSVPILPKPEAPFVTRSWLLPEIESVHLKLLTTPKVELAELPEWNQLCRRESAPDILEAVIRDLRAIVEESEKLPPRTRY